MKAVTSAPSHASNAHAMGVPGHVHIPMNRRRADLHIQHGMKVTILGEDPQKTDRFMVQLPGCEKPVSMSKEIVRRED